MTNLEIILGVLLLLFWFLTYTYKQKYENTKVFLNRNRALFYCTCLMEMGFTETEAAFHAMRIYKVTPKQLVYAEEERLSMVHFAKEEAVFINTERKVFP